MNRKKFNIIAEYLKFLSPYKTALLTSWLFGAIVLASGLIKPYLAGLLVDRAFVGKDLRMFIVISLSGAGVFILAEIASGVENYLGNYIKTRLDFDFSRKMLINVLRLPVSRFLDSSTGGHMYRMNYDIERAAAFTAETLPQFLYITIRFALTLGIVAYMDYRLAVLSVFIFPLVYMPSRIMGGRLQEVWDKFVQNSEDMFVKAQEFFSHAVLIKAFSREKFVCRNYTRALIKNLRLNLRYFKTTILANTAPNLANSLFVGLIAFYGGYRIVSGTLSAGHFTAAMIYFYQLGALQAEFGVLIQDLSVGLVSCRRIREMVSGTPAISSQAAGNSFMWKDSGIAVKNVTFGYKPGRLILKNISMTFESGRHIALAGASGCGKTTLLNLLLKFFEPLEGEIFVGGMNIRNADAGLLHEKMAVAMQEPMLFNDSLINNMRFGCTASRQYLLEKCAEVTGVSVLASGLPSGYDTIIGENACKISEGQKQRIAIARALAKKPDILLLDEALSSLDSKSEEEIISGIRNAFENITLITVSHRLSALALADAAYFMRADGGVEKLSPKNLAVPGTQLRELFAGQGV